MRTELFSSPPCVAYYCLLLGGLSVGGAAQAQVPLSTQYSSITTGRNIVRVDWFAPLGTNFGYNLLSNRGLLMPVLVSYERAVANQWSVGAEALLNGGYPGQRRKGVGLMARYYVRPDNKTASSLAGLYVAPVVSYLSLKVTDEPPLLVVRAHRLRTGVFLGRQHKLLNATPRIMLDMAVGVMYWSAIGTDQVSQPGNVNGTEFGILKPNFFLDVRGGIGYQF